MERWCVVTPKEFRCYKNQWNSNCSDIKPLITTPIKDIVAIFRVILDLPLEKRKLKELKSEKSIYKELYQFEIFIGKSEYPYLDEKLDENVGFDRLHSIDLDGYNGFNMWKNYLDEKKKSSQRYVVNKDHLMRPPIREHRQSMRQNNLNRERSFYSSPGGSMDLRVLSTGDKGRLPLEKSKSFAFVEQSKSFTTV